MRSIGAALVVALASGLAPQTKPSAAKVQQKARGCVDLIQIASRTTPSTRRRARRRICSLAWVFHAIDATSPP